MAHRQDQKSSPSPTPDGQQGFQLALLGLLIILAAGCRPDAISKPQGYYGPTLTMQEVVTRINANNQSIATLWAAGDAPTAGFEAWIARESPDASAPSDTRLDYVNGELRLLYQAPGSLLLVGRKDVAGRVFELGTNEQTFWLIAKGAADTMWWGRYDDLSRAESQAELPIPAYLILDVLAVGAIPTDFLSQPMPVMRFNNDADAYMFVWQWAAADRLVAQKEVWYDRSTLLPRLVLLFDRDGRIVLRAYLSDHRPVEGSTRPDGQPAMVATHFKLFFPDNGSKMNLTLSELRSSRNGIPNPRSFLMPDPQRADVSRIIPLDPS